MGHFPAGGGGGGSGTIEEITSTGDTVDVTDPTGPVTNLEVAGGGGSTLDLTYNGTGPVSMQVLDGLDYDPTVGGVIFAIMPASINPWGVDTPAFLYVDSSSTIQIVYIPQGPQDGSLPHAWDATGQPIGISPVGLTLPGAGTASPTPGNTPNGVDAEFGMVLSGSAPDIGTGTQLWYCTTSYDPVTPADAVWVNVLASGGGGAPTLDLSYNGAGPTTCQVLNGLSWSSGAGGYLFIVLPGGLSGLGEDFPAYAFVDGTGTIQSFSVLLSGETGGLTSFGPTLDEVPFEPSGLIVGTTSGNPGNTPNGVNATEGMAIVDTTADGLWVCTGTYLPDVPTNAVWDFIGALGVTVNDGPLESSGIVALQTTRQPIVDRLLPILQPLPPLFGFEFSGSINTGPTLNEDSVPQAIAAGPDRNLWLCDSGATTPGIWRIAQNRATTLFPTTAGSTPMGLCFTAGGYWWLTDPARASYWYASGTIYGANTPTEQALGSGASPGEAICGPDGNAWAIDTRSGGGTGVWQLSTNGGGNPGGTLFPFGDSTTQLVGICSGPDGNMWVSDSSGFVWLVTTAGVATSFAVDTGFTPGSITTGPDGRLWVVGTDGGNLAVLAFGASDTGAISAAPAVFESSATPNQMIAGAGGDLWMVDSSSALWLIPTDFFTTGGTDDIPVSFALPGAGAMWMCATQDGCFAISQTTSGGATWLAPFQLVVPSLLIAEGDATFTTDAAGPTGPVVTDQSDGHTYRIITTAGLVSAQLVT